MIIIIIIISQTINTLLIGIFGRNKSYGDRVTEKGFGMTEDGMHVFE
jgi:hypothetical protein